MILGSGDLVIGRRGSRHGEQRHEEHQDANPSKNKRPGDQEVDVCNKSFS
jgi:hypothetical protein